MRIARRFLISGRVQGVGFRYFTEDVAAREGVTGFVRNTPDGNVEALVEGDEEAVMRVERAIRMGPGGARVEAVYVSKEEPSGAYRSFNVTRTP
jgi:acylphosphatase